MHARAPRCSTAYTQTIRYVVLPTQSKYADNGSGRKGDCSVRFPDSNLEDSMFNPSATAHS